MTAAEQGAESGAAAFMLWHGRPSPLPGRASASDNLPCNPRAGSPDVLLAYRLCMLAWGLYIGIGQLLDKGPYVFVFYTGMWRSMCLHACGLEAGLEVACPAAAMHSNMEVGCRPASTRSTMRLRSGTRQPVQRGACLHLQLAGRGWLWRCTLPSLFAALLCSVELVDAHPLLRN